MLIIFDLDGVLIDSREIHYVALNNALAFVDVKYVIDRTDHLSKYDGLPTSRKLELLTLHKGLPKEQYKLVWAKKQEETVAILKTFDKDDSLIEMFVELKKQNHNIAVASNSIKLTLETCLHSLGILNLVDYYVSNEDVSNPKPHPEMFWKCMSFFKCLPNDTVILEDSHIGREAVLHSGCPNLIPISNPKEVTLDLVLNKIRQLSSSAGFTVPWIDNQLNVLVPMAGMGSRFKVAGYKDPKPLIEFFNKPMISHVVDNLNIQANYIFLVLREHYETYNLHKILNLIKPECKIVIVDSITEGAACTSLLAKEFIDNENPLLISNSDQLVDWNSNECMYAFSHANLDGGMLVFKSDDPKWSYARLDNNGMVIEVAEKKVISDFATVGIYYWSHGSDYVKYAEKMIEKNIRTNNEFYICPVFNEAISDGKKIRIKYVARMHGLGTPEDLEHYLAHQIKLNNNYS